MAILSQSLLGACLQWQNVLLFGLLGFVFSLLYNRYGHGLHKVPGPFLASISSFGKFYVLWRKEPHTVSVALHEKYGPLVRIGPFHVSAASSEAVSAIYLQKKGFKKTDMYNILQPDYEGGPLHNVFSTQDQGQHAALKRSIGSLYSTSAVLNYEPNLDRSLTTLVERLQSQRAQPLDASAWLQFWAFDALGEVNFSCPLGFLNAGQDIDGICHLDQEMMQYFGMWGQIPRTERFLSRMSTWTQVLAPNPLLDLTLQKVRERTEKPTDHKDMLNDLLRTREKKPGSFSPRELVAAAYINVVTAHEVLAISLRAVLYYLYKTPRCYEKLMSEIRLADAEGRFSTPVKYTEASGMQYLMAVINETLRIHPSTGIIFERYVPEGGLVLHDQYLPAGTIVGVNAWVMNRNKEIYGDDAETFRPERWIEASPDRLDEMRKCLGTWGYGARNCIGKNLAMIQIIKVLIEIYRNFDVELAYPQQNWHVAGSWLTTQTEMDMIFRSIK